MAERSTFDKFPCVRVAPSSAGCQVGWPEIIERLQGVSTGDRCILTVECYPGVFLEEVERALSEGLKPARIVRTADYLKPAEEIQRMLDPFLTDDPVFGRMSYLELADFFNRNRFNAARRKLSEASGLILVIGTGASLLATEPDILVYADMARWEIQQRQRKDEIANLGADNYRERPLLKYKRAFFVDWRVADRLKKSLFAKIDFLLDTNDCHQPKMITGKMLLDGLRLAAGRPFEVVPFFDPAPWGGQWMKEVCDLPRETPNYGWCFNCVPEENSLLLEFGGVPLEVPAINLVFRHPRELLGDAVHARFGTEFPIRFDFLDTWEGGNLSLQVHPLTEYIQEKFGVPYTQDESYYLLDTGDDGCVYLGLKEGIDSDEMVQKLREAQNNGAHFPVEKYVNRWPARKHDHFLIPGGTIHCSGRNCLVLEISATPYIFTFKLWDWGRLGLDGRPRPIHINHGAPNIQWDRNTDWVRRNLINRVHPTSAGDGWREERTGLHKREFIETRRHWFSAVVPHQTKGSVNVLNLAEGKEAVVESPSGAFDPFVVHYAETFIVPAAVGEYTIRPHGPSEGMECATIKAYVRTAAAE